MRRFVCLTVLILVALTPVGITSPTDGVSGKHVELAPATVKVFTKTFRGGERACVLAVGGQAGAATNLQIEVRDQNNVRVGIDEGSGLVGDCVAVIWYPPRDGAYRIELRNTGAVPSNPYFVIK